MIVRLEYPATEYLDIRSISVIGPFNGSNPSANPLVKSGDCWSADLFFPPGEHHYKFLVNDEFKLNDPWANLYLPDEKGQLWSTILINENHERLYNNEQYTVDIEDYVLTNTVTSLPEVVSKKAFSLTMDRSIVARFEFTNISGLHTVTALWYDSWGHLHEFTENLLYSDKESLQQSVFLWFWIDLNEPDMEYPEGIWTIKLLIDGKFILEDQMTLLKTLSYSPNGYLRSVNL